jgi:hypothetical protein
MLSPDDPSIAPSHQALVGRIEAAGVMRWAREKLDALGGPSLESLVYLCKFCFFTALVTKAQIGQILGADRAEVKALVRSWYDDHRAKGCGTC